MKRLRKLKKLLYSPQYLLAIILFISAIFFYIGAEKQRDEFSKSKKVKQELKP